MEEIDMLIARRPVAYTRLGFQRFLLWMFILCGIILFFNTVYIIVSGLTDVIFIMTASHEIADRYRLNQQDVEEILIKYLEPIKYKAILYSFFLSLALFLMARYAQKVINRNKYILLLEREWTRRRITP